MTGGVFHSTERCLVPGEVEVAAIGDIVSGARTVISREALEKVAFLYLLDGCARVRFSDADTLTLKADDILVVFPGRVLTVELTGRSNRLMSVALVGRGAVAAALRLGYWDLMRASERYEGNYMAEIIDLFHAAPTRGRDLQVLSRVEHLLSNVWLLARHGGGQGPFFDAVRTLNRCLCAGTSLTSEAAAAELGISRSKINTLFLGGCGIRPGEYISRVVVQLAQAALFWTRMPVLRIATDLGFSSSSAFAAFLRRMTGQTPLQFRRNPIRTH